MNIKSAILISACFVLMCALPSRAQQKGQWVPGQLGLNAGVIPDPGITYANQIGGDDGDAERNQRLPQFVALEPAKDEDLHQQADDGERKEANQYAENPLKRRYAAKPRSRDKAPSKYSEPCARLTLRISPNTERESTGRPRNKVRPRSRR